MVNETLNAQVTTSDNSPITNFSSLPEELATKTLSFFSSNKDIANGKLVLKEWQEYAKKALVYYAKGRFDPKYIDTAFLSKLQVPLEHARTFIDYRYKGLQEDKNDIQLDRYFEGNAAAITPIAQETVTVETLITILEDLEKKQQQINSKQKVEIEYTINSLEDLVNYIKAYDQLKDKHYLLKIDINQNESSINQDLINPLLDIIKLSNDQNLQQSINISYNNEVIQITYDQAKHIANHITVLELASCGIKAEGAKTIAGYLKTNTTLTSLNLGYNDIGTAGAIAIADTLNTNKTLASLDLKYNDIGAAGAKDLADTLKTNTTLASLDLELNGIKDAGAKDLASALKVNKSLASLNLELNSVRDAGAKDLADALETNTALTSLNLAYNNIKVGGAKDLANALTANKALTSLKLDINNIGDAGAKDLAKALKTNTALTHLDLTRNEIGAAGAKDLANALEINKALRFLNLRMNYIKSAGAKDLADALKTNKALAHLDLTLNYIEAAGAIAIAYALQTNKTLTSLSLEENNIGAAGASALGKVSAYVKMTQNRDITIVLNDNLGQSFNAAREEELARLEKLEAQEKLKSPKSHFVDMVAGQEKQCRIF
ncbi:leucine-rich repeat domain-containing protein [Rickettsiales endosymbiont of Stachyamoeba lipophora]|uniref:hypothetical protein n=1 Tax=Rickettsiales endosymbiont of Stachyamoeba lipophora TaxID=2486578 RepID=UPI000F653FD0|nr:hypothetical protein [Rickettsiales endosymbiont of Stachyamoeba lipophora]AZL16109.1 hypothetical protein EF513_06140 [Rickettsiales endosymbiont of Stachyamoeba lipophora]